MRSVFRSDKREYQERLQEHVGFFRAEQGIGPSIILDRVGQPASRTGERQGDFLAGKYLLGDCLGIGGMGEVYRATNMSLGRNVAVKILNKEHTANEDDVLRFLREARAAAAVRHPNVVDVFDVARDDDGTPFIVQELLAGEDLEQYLLGQGRGRLSVAEAIEIMIPVAEAVGAAHAHQVVHRDLKPANIFLAKEGTRITPKVLDFGACLYQTVGALSAKERRMLIGTPHYMAPEQVTTAGDVDGRADVWAIGVILFELLCGETPFEAEDVNQVLKYVRTRDIPPLREIARKAPESLEAVVGKCLERDRKKRYADAGQLGAALEKVRDEVKGAARKKIDTPPDLPDEPEPPSIRIPSLALKPRPPTRRGASLFALGGPDDDSVWNDDLILGPKSAPRPIEAAKPEKLVAREPPSLDLPASGKSDAPIENPHIAKFEPQEASLDLDEPAPPKKSVPAPAGGRRSVPPPPANTTSVKTPGEARHLDLGSKASAAAASLDLDLDLEPPSRPSNRPKAGGSLPPVLDPRAAAQPRKADVAATTDPPERRLSRPDGGRGSISVSPPPLGTPPSMRSPPRPSAASFPSAVMGEKKAWTTNANLAFVGAIAGPALLAFVILRFLPVVLAPLASGMRGESPLASGVLAVTTLVGAAALTIRAFSGDERSKGLVVAALGAIALGILMIIVTFGASETAELGVPPATAGVVPFVAPVVPLGALVFAVGRARDVFLSKYERRESILYVALASFLVLAVLEVGPAGAVRSVPLPTPPAPPHAAP